MKFRKKQNYLDTVCFMQPPSERDASVVCSLATHKVTWGKIKNSDSWAPLCRFNWSGHLVIF